MIERLSTGRPAIHARKVLRRFPRLKKLAEQKLLKGDTAAYEQLFEQELISLIRPGDVVWDIGANVGIYTSILSNVLGDEGTVVAFEPAPGCQPILQGMANARHNVVVKNLALSNADGVLHFDTSGGATHVNNRVRKDGDTKVRAARADSLVNSGETPKPDVVKIDVEGFEVEVIEGFSQVLAESPRAMLVEVHFGQLSARGHGEFPVELPKILRSSGFSVKWVDPSHLAAVRRDSFA